jgi:glycosyltransferase involved in cell wall biosynthesis
MTYHYSIVITTFNRRALLVKCLDSLAAQTFDHSLFEVCIVDDGSRDGTASILNERSYPFPCRIMSIPNAGPSNARNLGARSVSGAFIVFLEDDVTVHPDWLHNAHTVLKSGTVDVLEGRTIYQTTKKDVRRFDAETYVSFIPCNLFVRREVFLESGGYDPAFFAPGDTLYFRDDTELGFRMMEKNITIVKDPAVIAEHPEQFSDLRRCFRHAMRYQFDPLLYKKHPAKYRSSIDVKRLFGITMHRPHHYAYFTHILLTSALMLSLFNVVSLPNAALFAVLVGFTFMFRFKYQGSEAFKVYQLFDFAGFFVLPFVYAYAFIKGCFRYRSFGALL